MGRKYCSGEEYVKNNIFCDQCGECLTDYANGEDTTFAEKEVAVIDGETFCMNCLEQLTVKDWVEWIGGKIVQINE